MSTATGKKSRKLFGGNRHSVHRNNHTPKSEAKIRRMGWTRTRV
jgi:hypothetical protein